MAINKKLVHFKTYAAFETELNAGNILETSVVWIKETKQMYTHGEYYDCSGLSEEDTQKLAVILSTGDGTKYLADDGTYKTIDLSAYLQKDTAGSKGILGEFSAATGETEAELTPVATDTISVAIGKLFKAILDNEEVTAAAIATINESLGFSKNAEFQPTNATLQDKNVTEAIDYIEGNSILSAERVAQLEAHLEALKSELEALGACGFARVNGSVSCDAEVTFGSKQKLSSLASHLKLGVVNNGKLVKECAPCRLTKSVDNKDIAIDGTEGDVMNYVDCDIYYLKATMNYTPQGGTEAEYNIIALSLTPFSIGGKEAKLVKPFAIVPGECVTAQLANDLRNCAHFIYNKNFAGTYSAPSGIFKQSYKTSGGGYPTQYVSSVQSIKNAQAKNDDITTNRPYMGMYYEFYEIIFCLMSFELGTLAHTRLNLFGVGITTQDMVSDSTFNDTAISANSGFKYIAGDYTAFGHTWAQLTYSGSTVQTIDGIAGVSHYGVVEIMEAQRVLDGIAKANLISKIGVSTNIFSFDADENVVCTDDGSINLSTGEGMEVCKHYYIVRSVPDCEGMENGVMTAVVNSYTKLEFADGVTNGSNSLDGGICIMKRSIPIYRGWNLPLVGMFRQMDGAYYILRRDADGNDLPGIFRCASDVTKVPARTTYTYEVTDGEECDMEIGLDLIKEYEVVGNTTSSTWIKSSDYNLSLFCSEQLNGGSRSYENQLLWQGGQKPANGNKQLHGSVVGCFAAYGDASARSATCSYHAGSGHDLYAGAFATPILQLS